MQEKTEIVDYLQQNVVDIVEALKAVAPEVWEILMRQQFVIGVTVTVSLCLFVTVLLGALVWNAKDNWRSDGALATTVVSGIGSALLFIIFMVEALPRLLNPAYYALMALIPGA